MRELLCSISLLLASFLSFTQSGNLVRNGDFEKCIMIGDSFHFAFAYVDYWYNPSLYATPDYLNRFTKAPYKAGVPRNLGGFQQPKSGDGYAGLYIYARRLPEIHDSREYIATRFLSPLIEDSLYQIEFYMSLGDTSRFAVNRIGVLFDDDSIEQFYDSTIDNKPQIAFDSNLYFTDTQNWVRFCKFFVAQGNEKYLAIGNFYRDSQTSAIEVRDSISPLFGNNLSYLFIDDVSLYQLNSKDSSRVCKNDTIYINHKPISLPGLYYDSICDIGLPHYVFWAEDTSQQTLVHPYGQSVSLYGNDYSGDTTLYFQLQTVNLGCDSTHKVILVSETNPGMLPAVQTFVQNGTWQIENLQANDEVQLYNALGQKVFYQKANGSQLTSSLQLSAGIYLCSISRNGKIILSEKIVVVK